MSGRRSPAKSGFRSAPAPLARALRREGVCARSGLRCSFDRFLSGAIRTMLPRLTRARGLSMNDTYVPGELEHCVLSVIWRIQPCTAYQVRRAFQTSLTASWRASTGSIYPLLRKLVAKGFVIQAAIPGDRRHGQALKISPAAAQSLKSWLQDSSSWIAEPVADPIRTRSYGLPLLEPREASG